MTPCHDHDAFLIDTFFGIFRQSRPDATPLRLAGQQAESKTDTLVALAPTINSREVESSSRSEKRPDGISERNSKV